MEETGNRQPLARTIWRVTMSSRVLGYDPEIDCALDVGRPACIGAGVVLGVCLGELAVDEHRPAASGVGGRRLGAAFARQAGPGPRI